MPRRNRCNEIFYSGGIRRGRGRPPSSSSLELLWITSLRSFRFSCLMFHVYLHRGIKSIDIWFQDWGNNWKGEEIKWNERWDIRDSFVWKIESNMMNWLYLFSRKYERKIGRLEEFERNFISFGTDDDRKCSRKNFYDDIISSTDWLSDNFQYYEFTRRYIIYVDFSNR